MTSSLLWLSLLEVVVLAYLSEIEINTLNELYMEWNGDYWSPCKWNMQEINNQSKNNHIPNYCGLSFKNHSNQTASQYVSKINFHEYNYDNVTGIIPSSISGLLYLEHFRTQYNDFHGVLPDSICQIHGLSHFFIYGSSLIGSVPNCFFDLHYLKRIAFYDARDLSLTQQNIEQLCYNKYVNSSFYLLMISKVKYVGSIPFCIGDTLPELGYLEFACLYNTLTGNMPSSINNLRNLQFFKLYKLPQINKTNKVFLNLTNLNHINTLWVDLNIFELEMDELCNLQLDGIFLSYHIVDDERFQMIEVPNHCILSNNSLWSYTIRGNGLIGTIDDNLCTQMGSLQGLEITNTTNFNIVIPECLSMFQNLIIFKLINNTKLYNLPSEMLNSSLLRWVQIQNNSYLTGKINHLFASNTFSNSNLLVVALDHNNFNDNVIDYLLEMMLTRTKYLTVFTLHNNEYLCGSLPILKNETYLDYLQVLTLHNNNIYGVIPDKLFFSRKVRDNVTKLITLHGNRISGSIPNDLLNINKKSKYLNITFLPGNHFTILNKNDNNWFALNSLFINAHSLYISLFDIVLSYCLSVIAFSTIIVSLIYVYFTVFKRNHDIGYDSLFLNNLRKVLDILFDPYFIAFVIILIIFYAFNSTYYQQNTFISRFSLFNFYSK
eukprot:438245_1